MHLAAHSEMLSPGAAAHVPHAGAHQTAPIESAGLASTKKNALRDFLIGAAHLDRRIMQQSLGKLHGEDVFIVSGCRHVESGLLEIFDSVCRSSTPASSCQDERRQQMDPHPG